MPKLIVRWSAFRAWRKCPQLYFNRYIRQLEKRKPEVPLIRGSIIGKCLDRLAEGKKITPVIKEYQKEYGKLFTAEREVYGDIIPECERIVENYQVQYDGCELDYQHELPGKPYEIEVRAAFKVGNLDIEFQGHIDKLPFEERRGLLFVMDHKTHKVIPNSDARFNDLQLVTYLWLVPQSDLGLTPDGVIWDYLCTKPPTVPEMLKRGGLTRRENLASDYNTYLKAIIDNGLDPADYQVELERQRERSEGKYFDRVYLPTPPKEMIENMVADFKANIQDIWDATKRNYFVRHMTRECSQCSYYQLCSAELRGIDAEFILKSQYNIIDGDPHHGKKHRITSIKEVKPHGR